MSETVPAKVSIADKKQLNFWCKYLGCSASTLEEALKKVGSSTEEVKLYLSKQPGKKGLAFWWEFMK